MTERRLASEGRTWPRSVLGGLLAGLAAPLLLGGCVGVPLPPDPGGVHGMPLVGGNRVTLLQDGPSIDDAMVLAIDTARDHVNLETYIFKDDRVGRRVADALLRARERGVRVNLLYDSFGSFDTSPAFFDRLAAAGVRTLAFNPLSPFHARGTWAPNNRDHRKLLIVDGAIAIFGGANIQDPRPISGEARWRDTDLRVDGPVVAQFQTFFARAWNAQRGPPLDDANYFPVLSPQGREQLRAVGESPQTDNIYHVLVREIASAKKRVLLTTPYFVPDRRLLMAMEAASRNGVDVRLLLPSQSDFPPAMAAARSTYGELLDAGVQIYERQEAVMHAKTAMIDGTWSTVGSANLDMRSFAFNFEINAIARGPDVAGELERLFALDIAHSRKIEKARWAARPVGDRALQWLARLFWFLW